MRRPFPSIASEQPAAPSRTALLPAPKRGTILGAASFLLLLGLASAAEGQLIDVSTLPDRESVQLTIYNGEDITLVRETRHVTVRKGESHLQFSWANTLIDPTSVQLRPLDGRIDVVDTAFPHDRPEVLTWTVRSPEDAAAEVEITYFTSGITWSADYVGVVNPAETEMAFDGFVTITNNSGEDYAGASVRMVVGTINLVERITALAQRGLVEESLARKVAVDPAPKAEVRRAAGLVISDALSEAQSGNALGGDAVIVKEGLSEYFVFSVPGTQTVKTGWSKRMRLFAPKGGTKVPFRIEYRYRPQEYGEQLARLFLVRNDEASTLGESPLPDGAVRLFRRTADDGLSVLGFLSTKYVPIGQEFEFNLGADPQVILERLVLDRSRGGFWFRREGDQRLYSPDKGDRIDPKYAISGWDDHERRVERIRNYRSEAVKVAFRYGLDGDVTFRNGLGATLFDFRSPEYTSTVEAGKTSDLGYEVVTRQGTNAKQARVELEVSK